MGTMESLTFGSRELTYMSLHEQRVLPLCDEDRAPHFWVGKSIKAKYFSLDTDSQLSLLKQLAFVEPKIHDKMYRHYFPRVKVSSLMPPFSDLVPPPKKN